MPILLKYTKEFVSYLETLIIRQIYIQKAPSIYIYMNEKRNKRLTILNMKKEIDKKRKKILTKYGLKKYYSSKKEYKEHLLLIKKKIQLK